MYDNIGKKIKTLMKIVTIVLSVASIIVAIVFIVRDVPWGLIFFFCRFPLRIHKLFI